MASHTIWGVLFLCLYFVCYNATLGHNWKLSKEENLEIERQLETLNKPSVKTIVSEFGDIYDCVDFYKQPAFDHPLLKNFTSDFQLEYYAKKYETSEQAIYAKSDAEECPSGTVPIQRIMKKDLIKEKLALKARRLDTKNGPSVPFHAIARTKPGPSTYAGAGGFISIHNPTVRRRQFSASRIKIRNGDDAIQVGWRVDPSLYRDTQTRLYIHTDAGQSHCFNTYCPGFVITNPRFPLNFAIPNTSKPGGPLYELKVSIVREKNGNWNLQLGPRNILIGFWPWRIFTGLKHLANYVEWGGSAYFDPRYIGPQMGTGDYPTGDPQKDAYIRKMTEVNEQGQYVDADNVEAYAEHYRYYSVIDRGNLGGDLGHLIVYGGPGLRNYETWNNVM